MRSFLRIEFFGTAKDLNSSRWQKWVYSTFFKETFEFGIEKSFFRMTQIMQKLQMRQKWLFRDCVCAIFQLLQENKWDKFIEFTKKVSKLPIFLCFWKHCPNFRPFPNIYFNQKTQRLLIETCIYQKWFEKTTDKVFCTTVKLLWLFDFICLIFSIQKPPSKITRYGVQLQIENFPSYFVRVLKWCKHSTTANWVSSRLNSEETSVVSC